MDEELLLLSSDNFQKNASMSFRELWEDKDIADVTLVTGDDQQIKAHKVILSSCSTFFKKVFVKNQHRNILIYLTNIRKEDLDNLLRFVYLGQCEVSQEHLKRFLNAAKQLNIKELDGLKPWKKQLSGELEAPVKEFEEGECIDLDVTKESLAKRGFQTSKQNKSFEESCQYTPRIEIEESDEMLELKSLGNTCLVCQKTYTSFRSELLPHYCGHFYRSIGKGHEQYFTDEKCILCGVKLSKRKSRIIHLGVKHEAVLPFILSEENRAEIRSKKSSVDNQIKVTQIESPNENLNLNSKFTFKQTKDKCKFCGQETQTRKRLMKHYITRHFVGEIAKLTVDYINRDKCVKCGQDFKGAKRSSKNIHVGLVHKEIYPILNGFNEDDTNVKIEQE